MDKFGCVGELSKCFFEVKISENQQNDVQIY